MSAPSNPPQTPVPPKAPEAQPKVETPQEVPLFHFAECTNCKHILPLSTTTEKYFAILSKNPNTPTGLGEKCMRCGADSWVLSR